MQVRPKKRASPRKQPDIPATPAVSFSFPAPIKGLVLNENLAMAEPGGASVLDNWVCTTTGARVRGGKLLYATLDDTVEALFSYRATNTLLLAATETSIFDISNVVDPEVAPTPVVTGQTSGDWSTVQFGTAGGNFLYAVNGADNAQLFDGTTWTEITGASTPAVTGVDTADLAHVWNFGSRVWFVEKDTQTAWYLPVDSIAGAAEMFPLAGVFTKGGTLLFGAKWSMDAGDGLDDKCVFVSSEGEIAVYEGTNPASAADWRLAGRYDFPRPLGKSAVVGAGGDLLIATEVGMIPISAAISSDIGAIETKAVSNRIKPLWRDLIQVYPASWTAKKFNLAGYMIVSAKDGETCLVVNLTTGGWSRFTGWDVLCMEEAAGQGYIGGGAGTVYLIDISGSDAGEIYEADYLGAHDSMGAPGGEKTVKQARATFRYSTPFKARVNATTDFSTDLGAPPSSIEVSAENLWGTGLWDDALWDGGPSAPMETRALWSSVGVTGAFVAPSVQITMGSGPTPQIELVGIDVMFHLGATVA